MAQCVISEAQEQVYIYLYQEKRNVESDEISVIKEEN
jgi:hypothetical protein